MQPLPARVRSRGPGLTPVAAVLLAFGLSVLGGLVDAVVGSGLGWTFRILFVVGSVLAAALVCRRGLRAAAVAPPLVYAGSVVLFGLARGGSAPRTPTAHVMNLATELIFGAPSLVLGTVGAVGLVLARIARRS